MHQLLGNVLPAAGRIHRQKAEHAVFLREQQRAQYASLFFRADCGGILDKTQNGGPMLRHRLGSLQTGERIPHLFHQHHPAVNIRFVGKSDFHHRIPFSKSEIILFSISCSASN